jgi:hypothetical protein
LSVVSSIVLPKLLRRVADVMLPLKNNLLFIYLDIYSSTLYCCSTQIKFSVSKPRS